MNENKAGIIFTIFLVLFIAGGAYIFVSKSSAKTEKQLIVDEAGWNSLADDVETKIRRFPGVAGIVIKDLRSGLTIKYNEDKLFPSASLVKIPVMAAVFQREKEGKLSLSQRLTLKSNLKQYGSGRLKYCPSGSSFSIKQLLELMITESDNTATNLLTNQLGFEYLNQTFSDLGLSNTNMIRSIMDLHTRDLGIENYTTADEMAFLLEKIYQKSLVSEEASERMLTILSRQKINDRLSRGLPKGWVVAHKTGLMRSVCHDVGIVYHSQGDFIVCVLTDKINSYPRAKKFISDIAKITFQYYENRLQPFEEYCSVKDRGNTTTRSRVN